MKAHITWEAKDICRGLNGRICDDDGFVTFRVLLKSGEVAGRYLLSVDNVVSESDVACSDQQVAAELNKLGAVPNFVESNAELKSYNQNETWSHL